MKNKFYKLLLFIFMLIVCINRVNADFSCSSSDKVTLTETTKSSPAKFQAYMPICGRKEFVKHEIVEGNFKDANSALAHGEDFTISQQADDDNKDSISINVRICDDPQAKVQITIPCEYYITGDAHSELQCPTEYENYECDVPCDANGIRRCKNRCLLQSKSSDDNSSNIKRMGNTYDCEAMCEVSCTMKGTCTRCTQALETVYSCPDGEGSKSTHRSGEICEYYYDYNYIKDYSGKSVITTDDVERFCKNANDTEHCRCYLRDATYQLKCPVYRCIKENTLLDLCTPNFKDPNNNPVYCVNPSNKFSPDRSSTAEYMVDPDFDVTSCLRSNDTVDCGYGNILIEGEYNKLEDKIIEFALRLWTAYTGQAGLNGVGVSNRVGETCGGNVYFMRNSYDGTSGPVINPYIETTNQFNKAIFERIRYRGYIDPNETPAFAIGCNSDVLGVACGGDSYPEYKKAIALFANTVIGNAYMQDHLHELVDSDVSENVTNADIFTDIDGTQYIEVRFKETITEEKKKINCDDLSKLVNEGKLTQEQKEYIEPFCKIEAVLVTGSGRELTEYGHGEMDYCQKNYCRVALNNFALCTVRETLREELKVKVIHSISRSRKSVLKYVSCSNPVHNQIMFSFDRSLLDSPNIMVGKEATLYSITSVLCEGTCNDYSLRGEIKDTCSNDQANYNQSFMSNIKDPSLKCIVNMDDPVRKKLYDYSEDFGVNTEFCRVFCSDEVEYYIADKVKSRAGEQFFYNIEESVNKSRKHIKYYFSNIIKEKRTCVSEIYYNNDFIETIDWKKRYSLGKKSNGSSDGITDEEIKGIKNIKTLLPVLIKKSKVENSRYDIVNRLLYNLYNCNIYTKSDINSSGIVLESDFNSYVKENVINKFSSDNKYGINPDDSCVINSDNNTCITMNDINYGFGARTDGNKVKMKSITATDNTLDNIVYCSGASCFEYNESNKTEEYNYPTSTTSSEKRLNIKFNKNKIVDAEGDDGILIPTNDYALFEVSTEVAFYNNSKFEVKPSGEVIYQRSGEVEEDYLKLPAYHYTVDKEAYNMSDYCKTNNSLGNYKRCELSQEFNKVATFFRNDPGDEFSKKVETSKKFSCFVDIEPPTVVERTEGTRYRNVDVSNMFPSSKDGFSTNKNSNWSTDNGKKVTVKINESANELRITDEYLEYSIVLSPEQIKNIKEYNKENDIGGYLNELKLKCQIIGDTYQNCLSPFLDELRRNTYYGTINSEYNDGISKKRKVD